MTTVTLTIADNGDELHLEGKLDDPEALNQPPTPAVIVGTYLATNAEQICKDAIQWFNRMVADQEQAANEPQLKLVLPGDGGLQ